MLAWNWQSWCDNGHTGRTAFSTHDGPGRYVSPVSVSTLPCLFTMSCLLTDLPLALAADRTSRRPPRPLTSARRGQLTPLTSRRRRPAAVEAGTITGETWAAERPQVSDTRTGINTGGTDSVQEQTHAGPGSKGTAGPVSKTQASPESGQ